MERINLQNMRSLVKHFMCIALIVLGAMGAWAQTNNTINLATVTSNITVNNGYTLTGTLGANVQISIANGATVTLNNVTINGVDNSSYNWAGITCNGNATIILVGENTVKGFYSYRSGIYVPENSTLTIQGSGSLTASSNGDGAGIGGYKGSSCGNINIAGGTIIANGGYLCPGIGGSGSNINISDGMVTATGGTSAPGIGGQQGGSCGNINITGGMVTATGGTSAPGIGGGQGAGCGTITIANTVTGIRAVKGGGSSPAPHSIGAGYGGSCGTVTVNGISSNGISTNPYSYPSYILTDIPNGWSVNADNINVTVTNGEASIPVGADVVLTPPSADKPRVKNVELLSPEQVPLTFEAKTTDGATVTFNINTAAATNTVQYSTDGNTWNDYTSGDEIPLNNIGDKVSFRGNNAAYAESSEGDEESHFSCSADCYVYGNVMSLIDPIYFATITELPSGHTFCSLFNNNSHIYNHPTKTLELPALTLSYMCYYGMFKGCTNLTTAPDLHATELDNWCYAHMFEGCTSLTTAPALPATTMKEDCYTSMFLGCTSLEIAPELPATELYGWCYSNMFSGCTSLTTAPELPATSLQQNCYQYMFKGCTNLTTAPELPAGTLVDECYLHMFDSCTSLVTVPDLPATTLDVRCYSSMFSGCSSLTTPPTLPATTLVDGCYYSMFSGCSSLTTAPMLPAETLVEYCYSHMFDSCKLLNHVTCLATDISASNCTANWLNKVAATGTFYKPTSVDWGTPGSSTIPVGWTAKDVMYATPLTFEAKEANATVTFTINANAATNGVEYSTDGTTWNTYTSGSPISLTNAGDKVSFRGNNATYATYNNDYIYSYFSCSADCYIYGNIMSLINEDNFANTTILTKKYTFCKLFENNDKIYNHGSKPLLLPATTLLNGCYWGMFSHCTQLTKAPALPATTLDNFCYAYMFEGCTKLETAPALPATTLANNCYSFMFDGCTQLTTAPILPATTLTVSCYRYMFNNCSHLNNVTCLATDISADDCTTCWLSNVAATGTFNKAASMTTWPTGPYDGNVDGIPTGWTVVTYETLLPLTFEAKTAPASVTFTIASAATNPVYISTDGENWSAYTSGTAIPLTNIGDKVSFRGNNARYATADEHSCFSCDKDCYIYGNVMSLINSTDYANTKVLTQNYALRELFYNNTHIVNHSSKTLVLPATTLTPWCYYGMFNGCTGLKTAPALPATNLVENCYMKMFSNCTSLETAPDLPATTLAVYCYQYMFYKCSGLTTAPAELHATTLAVGCYQNMFERCTGLKTAPELPATNLAENCYMYMFYLCTSLEEAPALPATTLADECYSGMFSGCTSLTTVPEMLPATILTSSCYNQMFNGCENLTTAPILPAPALVNRCYYYMFYGCTNLNRVTCLATSGINLNSSTYYWLYNVASSGTFTKNASTPAGSSGTSGQYWKTDNANGIPEGWTVADYIPEHLTGSGTSGDPYKIYNLTHWNEFAAKVNDGSEPAAHAKQMANIDVNNVQNALTIIGTSSHPFKGTYNGQGYTISQVNISGSSNNGNAYVGLFGYVDDASALIQNVVVASGSISVTGAASDRLNVGAIVGWLNKGTVQYCANYATVSSSSFSPSFIRCGGIVGIMYEGNANVQHCINFGDVSTNGTSGYYTGGIVGYVNLGSLTYCQNYGKITAKQCASGIGGYRSTNYGSIIINNNHNGGNLKISSTPYPAYNLIINDPNNESCPENTYLTSMTLTIGSNNYTGNDLSTYANGATGVTANPSGITIGGVTYAGPSGN